MQTWECVITCYGYDHTWRDKGSKSGKNEENWAEIVAAKVFNKSDKIKPLRNESPDHFQMALQMLGKGRKGKDGGGEGRKETLIMRCTEDVCLNLSYILTNLK